MMMEPQTITAHQAMADRARHLRNAKGAFLVAFIGVLLTALAGYRLIKHFSATALVLTLLGLLASSVGAVLFRRAMDNVRYRVNRPFATLLAVFKVAGILAVFSGIAAFAAAVDAPEPLGVVLFAGLIGGLTWMSNDHAKEWTAFEADALGVRFGRTSVPWTAIGQIVVSSDGPGTIEVGMNPAEGPRSTGTASTTADFPVQATVSVTKFRRDRLCWAIEQSGRPGIQLIDRSHP